MINRFLSHAQSFVFVSRYEGFGLPAIEAMAAGVPVLASTAGSLPEVCGDAAILVDPNSIAEIAKGMLAVNHDEARRQELRERGYLRAAKFSWDRCAEQSLGVILSGGKGDLQIKSKIGTV
jgi:glycosyltransferase involved in cell wall biosynthesis